MLSNPKSSQRFLLPPQGLFEPNDKDDPLPYYYKPVIGKIFRARIEGGLSLLTPPYERILEIGYGSGVVLPSLCRMSKDVHGVDLASSPDRVNLSLSQLEYNCNLFQGDIHDVGFEQESFDLIVAFSIFEHLEDLHPLIKKLAKYLRSDGELLVGMPRVDRFMDNAFKVIGFDEMDKHHLSDYHHCTSACKGILDLKRKSWVPQYLPETFGLYYTLLFSKKNL